MAEPCLYLVRHLGVVGVPLDGERHPRLIIGVQAREELVRAHADLVVGVAQHGLPAVGVDHLLLAQIPVEHAVARALDGELPALLAGAQRGLRLLARGQLERSRGRQPLGLSLAGP